MSGWRNSGVVVEVELAVEGQHVAGGRDDQRVDLGERGVGVDEELDEVLEERRPLLGRVAGEAERLADLPRLEIGQAEADVDRHAEDLLGGLVGDDLDLDSPFGRGHHDRALQAAVDRHAQVELAGDVVPDRDQHLGDRAALRHRSGRSPASCPAGWRRPFRPPAADLTSCTPLAIDSGRGLRPLAISSASARSSSGPMATPLPRPPACTWALTTIKPPPSAS